MGVDENAAIVRRGYEAFNAGDMKTLTEIFDEGAVWHTPGRSPLGRRLSGPRRGFRLFRPAGTGVGRDFPGRIAALACR